MTRIPLRLRPEVLRIVERVCLLVAVIALGWYAGVHVSAAREQASWARELERQSTAAMHRPAAAAARSRPVPAPRALIGRLDIPRLGLSAIAREGVDARTLRSAIGHVPNTALPGETGNAAFAGHRDTFFRKLQHVRKDDVIRVKTPDGEYEYVVRELKVVAPTDVSVLDPTDDATLTLVTCYPFDFIGAAPSRFIVRAYKK